MHNNKFRKIICGVVIIGTLTVGPFSALAQVADVPTSNSALGTGGILGTAANNLAGTALDVIDKANLACTTSENSFFKTDKAISFGMGGLALISDGTALQGQIGDKIDQIEIFKDCHQVQLNLAKAVVTPNIFTANKKQVLVDQMTKQIASLEAREEPLDSQLKLAQQGFWKTLVWNMLIKTTKTVAINMVNKLITQYHIADFAKYADAVATQVYDSEFILDNFSGSKADQMMVRSFLSNPLAQKSIQPQILRRADVALGFDPSTVPVSDPNYYQKMFYSGSGATNPFVMQATMSNAADTIHAKSLVTAQAEIAQSAGLKTPRDCRGTMAQQKSLDQSYDRVNKQLDDRQKLFDSLNNASKLGYSVSASDLKKATDDLAAAQKAWDVLPNSVDSPIVTICQAIVSPPAMISKGIDQGFAAIGQKMGTYSNNNLPFFINFITDVANSVTNQMIFGGGVNSSSLLNENMGNITRASNIAMSGINNYSVSLSSKNLSATTTMNSLSDDKKTGLFNLAYDASSVGNAQTVSITGPGLPSSVSGSMNSNLTNTWPLTLNVPGTYTYIITAYGKSSADILATVKLTVDTGAAAAQIGTVNGAFTSKMPPVELRGPEETASLRGD